MKQDKQPLASAPRAFTLSGLTRMRAALAKHVESGAVPGMVTLLARRGTVHVETLGNQALGGATPMRRDTLFRITSMTKPITAAAVMILVDDGKLKLDEPVERLLPELAERRVLKRLDGPLDETVPAKRAISVRDLLTFRHGFGIIFAPGEYPIAKAVEAEALYTLGPPLPRTPHTLDEWMRRFGKLPLMHQPGEKWMYNTGSTLQGALVARAAGQPLETFLRERIFEPLGMRDTAFTVPEQKLARFATSYQPGDKPGTLEQLDPVEGAWSRSPAFPDGGAGLVSTVDDYLAFQQMLLERGVHGERRILSTQAVEAMTRDQLTAEQKANSPFFPGFWDTSGWGFGLSVITASDELPLTPESFGWDGGFGTSAYADPKLGLAGILMTQCAASPAGLAVREDFWKSAYAALAE
jgi:CubicO group peptidase (beta-lactamase class C family)